MTCSPRCEERRPAFLAMMFSPNICALCFVYDNIHILFLSVSSALLSREIIKLLYISDFRARQIRVHIGAILGCLKCVLVFFMSLRIGRRSINKKCAKKAFCETLAKHFWDVCFEIQSAQLLGSLAQKRCCQHQVGKQIMRARS